MYFSEDRAMGNAAPVPQIKPAKRKQVAKEVETKRVEKRIHSTSLYDTFKEVYPAYQRSFQEFVVQLCHAVYYCENEGDLDIYILGMDIWHQLATSRSDSRECENWDEWWLKMRDHVREMNGNHGIISYASVQRAVEVDRQLRVEVRAAKRSYRVPVMAVGGIHCKVEKGLLDVEMESDSEYESQADNDDNGPF